MQNSTPKPDGFFTGSKNFKDRMNEDRGLQQHLDASIRGVDEIARKAQGYGALLEEGVDMVEVDKLMSRLHKELLTISESTLKEASEHRRGPSAPAA